MRRIGLAGIMLARTARVDPKIIKGVSGHQVLDSIHQLGWQVFPRFRNPPVQPQIRSAETFPLHFGIRRSFTTGEVEVLQLAWD